MNEQLTMQIVAALLRDGSVRLDEETLIEKVQAVVGNFAEGLLFKGIVKPYSSPGKITRPTLVAACVGGTYYGYSAITLDQFTIALFGSEDGATWVKFEVANAIKEAVAQAAAGETATEVPETGMQPRIYYDLGDIEVDTTFLLGTSIDGIDHYYFGFNTGDSVPTITWPTQVLAWEDDEAPEIKADKHYEISILNGVGAWLESSIPVEPENLA